MPILERSGPGAVERLPTGVVVCRLPCARRPLTRPLPIWRRDVPWHHGNRRLFSCDRCRTRTCPRRLLPEDLARGIGMSGALIGPVAVLDAMPDICRIRYAAMPKLLGPAAFARSSPKKRICRDGEGRGLYRCARAWPFRFSVLRGAIACGFSFAPMRAPGYDKIPGWMWAKEICGR